jgi:hypothetical protein
MIRLTELGAGRAGEPDQILCVRLDGALDAVGRRALSEALAGYRGARVPLIRLVLTGIRHPDHQACEHRDRVFTCAWYYLVSRADAEDATQEVLEAAEFRGHLELNRPGFPGGSVV